MLYDVFQRSSIMMVTQADRAPADVDLSKWTLLYRKVGADRLAFDLRAKKPIAKIDDEIEKYEASTFPSAFTVA